MRFIIPLLVAVSLCGCTGPKHVSSAEFQRQYYWVGKPQTMGDVAYLGQQDGKAFLKVRSMSTLGQKYSERIIFVELNQLEPVFRDELPKTQMK